MRELAEPSLHSANQRLRFAHYHYNAAADLLTEFSSAAPDAAVLRLPWSPDQDERAEYSHFRDKVAANAVACVQSLHAIADLLANGVFHALNLGRFGKPIKASQIDSTRALERLDMQAEFRAIAVVLREMLDNASFVHVDALSNQAKHRSITPIALNEDVTGLREQRFELRFSAFNRGDKAFGEAEVRTLLSPAYDAASHAIVATGIELTRLLKAG